MSHKRTPVIAGNWKMNKTVAEAMEIVKGLHYGLPWPGEVDVIVAPPFTALHAAARFLKDSYIALAAQDLFWEDSGAFTGQISGAFIKEAGADYVIIGHSERRRYFAETDETVRRKTKAALKHGLIPIVCIGETLEEREAGRVTDVILQQIKGGLEGLSPQEAGDLIIAYEPVWAIGTGKTAAPEQAEQVHADIRGIISSEFGSSHADSMRIIYGGSMKPQNAGALMSMENIDGGLIGGASLEPSDFIGIIKAVN
ncbi:MAG: triose-phosphate isomerase [Pseudomonadota bacterium]